MAISGSHVAAIVALLVAQLIGQEVYRTAATVGVFRKPQSTPVAPEDIVVFDGMLHCEDLHYEPASNRLFTACEDAAATRFVWWPPVANFDDPVAAMQSTGSLRVDKSRGELVRWSWSGADARTGAWLTLRPQDHDPRRSWSLKASPAP